MAVTTKFTKSREVREMTVTLGFADHTTPVRLFRLPANTRILDWIVNVKTAFSGGAAQELDLGIEGDPDAILDGLDVGAAGRVAITTELVQPGYETTERTDIYAQIDDTANTTGELDLTCIFSVIKLTRI